MRPFLLAATVSILVASSSAVIAATEQNTEAGGGGGKGDSQRPVAAWATRCSEAATPKDRICVLSKALVDPTTRKLMLAVTFRIAPPDRKPVMKLLLPVDLYLPAGVTLAVDDGATKTLKFETCVRDGCLAPVPLDAAFLQRLRKGAGIKVGYETVDQKPVDLTLKLDGFAKSFDQIK
jgi:invasion protein IalB